MTHHAQLTFLIGFVVEMLVHINHDIIGFIPGTVLLTTRPQNHQNHQMAHEPNFIFCSIFHNVITLITY